MNKTLLRDLLVLLAISLAIIFATISPMFFGGCMRGSASITKYRPNGSIESRTRASMVYFLTDSSKTDFKAKVKGLGEVGVGLSVLDQESLAAIMKEVYPWWMP